MNNGVAEVRDVREEAELRTLRYELETFVCEGQYEQGLSRILGTYLTNLDNPAQPAAWISGFFGSGKSHLAKMLRALWTDFEFPDGARARGLARLPQDIQDQLRELSTAGRRYAGVHAASGTLSAGADESVRLAFLGIVFRSVDLPQKYPFARFVLWLRAQGIEDEVRAEIESKGKNFDRELTNLYVSPVLAKALMKAIPGFADTSADALRAIQSQFPQVTDVSNDEVFEAVHDALSQDGQLPCTLVVLDEVQQYIGEARSRSIEVQELVEFCCNKFGGKLLLVATGQAALSGAALLERLQARFTVSVMLSDTDVEAVIREIVLAKRPDRVAPLREVLERHSGEITRQLTGTSIGHTAADEADLVRDYPLLPVRRRFWERVLRAVDRAGTAGQLRTQLKVVHEAVKDVAKQRVGWVVPADFLYRQLDHDLLSTGVLLREVRDDIIEKQRDGSADGELRARLCALIFLIGKLPREQGSDSGVRATPESLADLMVEDLGAGGGALRQRIPELLTELVDRHFLIQVEGEYRLQTKESQAWNNDFRVRYEQLLAEDQRLEHDRADRLRAEATTRFGGVKLQHGRSNVQRKVQLEFGRDVPEATGHSVPVWVRDGWQEDENAVVADAKRLGAESAVVLVHIPNRASEQLRKSAAAMLAASEVISIRPSPATPEGVEAREAMQTRRRDAEENMRSALETIFGGVQVFLAGGESYHGITAEAAIKDAAASALVRLFPQFAAGDDPKWESVIRRAKTGDGGALEAVGHKGDVDKHPVCKAVLNEIGSGKKGSDLRKVFQNVPYGWPQDTVDAALMILHLTGHVRATQVGVPLEPKQLDQTKIGPTDFRAENTVISTSDKIALRQLFQAVGVSCQPGEETVKANDFVRAALELAARAGGEPPSPAAPGTARLIEIRSLSGNDQLAALVKDRTTLLDVVQAWALAAQRINDRMPRWRKLETLAHHARDLLVAEEIAPQIESILAQRQLIDDPDVVAPLCERITAELRTALKEVVSTHRASFETQLKALEESATWQQVSVTDRARILAEQQLEAPREVSAGTEDEVARALSETSLRDWKLRTDAHSDRFARALEAAAKLLVPKARKVSLPHATLSTEADLDVWLSDVRARLMSDLENGPVIL